MKNMAPVIIISPLIRQKWMIYIGKSEEFTFMNESGNGLGIEVMEIL